MPIWLPAAVTTIPGPSRPALLASMTLLAISVACCWNFVSFAALTVKVNEPSLVRRSSYRRLASKPSNWRGVMLK